MPLEIGQRVRITVAVPAEDAAYIGRAGTINSVDASMEPLLPPLYGVALTSSRYSFEQKYFWEHELEILLDDDKEQSDGA